MASTERANDAYQTVNSSPQQIHSNITSERLIRSHTKNYLVKITLLICVMISCIQSVDAKGRFASKQRHRSHDIKVERILGGDTDYAYKKTAKASKEALKNRGNTGENYNDSNGRVAEKNNDKSNGRENDGKNKNSNKQTPNNDTTKVWSNKNPSGEIRTKAPGGAMSQTSSPTLSSSPTKTHTSSPTTNSSDEPTGRPSRRPTSGPTHPPTPQPSPSPTPAPTLNPTSSPTTDPTQSPSHIPSSSPTSVHTHSPSATQSDKPSTTPTLSPTNYPSTIASTVPSWSPSSNPSTKPTLGPSMVHSNSPSFMHSRSPSLSIGPTTRPTMTHSSSPSSVHSPAPSTSKSPSTGPTMAHSSSPTFIHSTSPSTSVSPSAGPTMAHSSSPTFMHSTSPSTSVSPSAKPVVTPGSPSNSPSETPSTSATTFEPTYDNDDTMSSPSSSSPTATPGDPTTLPSENFSPSPTYDASSILPTPVSSMEPAPSDTTTSGSPITPTDNPVSSQTESPTTHPTEIITNTSSPTISPTTSSPTTSPTISPTTSSPTISPTTSPTISPTISPTTSPTISPTTSPTTSSPTTFPTTSPTKSLTTSPTTSPTASPTTSPITSSPTTSSIITDTSRPERTQTPEATVTIRLNADQNGALLAIDEVTKAIFEIEVSDWLKNTISEIVLDDISSNVFYTQGAGERRKLTETTLYDSLYMKVNVTGTVSGDGTTTDQFFAKQVNIAFETFSPDLVSSLRYRANGKDGSPYFNRIHTIESVRGDIDDQIGNGVVGNTGAKVVTTSKMPIIIAAISSVGAVILFALAVFAFVSRRSRKGFDKDFDTGSSYEDEPSPQSSDDYNDPNQRWDYEQDQSIPVRIASQRHGNEDNRTESGNTYSTLDRLYATDNASYQSYGYSLEDGIGSKQTPSPPSAAERPSPMEVDMYGLQHQARYNFAEYDDATIEVSIGSPDSTYSGLTDLGTQAGFEPRARGNGVLQGGERLSPNTNKNPDAKPPLSPTRKTNKAFQRDCVAPPGKLGVVIDTTKHGPVVHMVKEGSPLEHVVFPGDKILSIDEVDTRGMTASGVTRVMAKKMHNQRTITVSSTQKSQFL